MTRVRWVALAGGAASAGLLALAAITGNTFGLAVHGFFLGAFASTFIAEGATEWYRRQLELEREETTAAILQACRAGAHSVADLLDDESLTNLTGPQVAAAARSVADGSYLSASTKLGIDVTPEDLGL